MSCCSGACKCHKFSDASNPTADECAAAVTCSTSEYCDDVLGKCLPVLRDYLQDCTGAAFSPSSTDEYFYDESLFCGSCNKSLGYKNYVNNTCTTWRSDACGSSQTQCKDHQSCYNGKCRCQVNAQNFFQWRPFVDIDPDKDNKLIGGGKVASGCLSISNSPIYNLLDGFFDRSYQTMIRFGDCITLGSSAIKSFTPADFQNVTFREMVCKGDSTSGTCPKAFCNELAVNFTGNDRSSFCSVARAWIDYSRSCTVNFIPDGSKTSDSTCLDKLAEDTLSYYSGPSFSWVDMYSFLGCESPKIDFIYHISIADRPAALMYRVETVKTLLGAAVGSQSLALTVLVTLISSIFIALM